MMGSLFFYGVVYRKCIHLFQASDALFIQVVSAFNGFMYFVLFDQIP